MIELSVIIPLYNGRKYIKELIDSILQIKHRKEIIVIDDGSVDNGYIFCCQEYGAVNEIKVLHKENSGIAETRNVGKSYANGKYILFADQDDYVCADVIDSAIEKAENLNSDIVFWSTAYWDGFSNMENCDIVYSNDSVCGEEIIDKIFLPFIFGKKSEYISHIGHLWGALFKKKVVDDSNISFKRFIHYEDDYLFLLDYLLSSNKVSFISGVGYLWRTNMNSFSHTFKYVDNYIYRSELYLNYIAEKCNFLSLEDRKKVDCYIRQNIIIKAIRNGVHGKNNKFNEYRLIKQALKEKEYRDAFKGDIIYPEDKRFVIMYKTIKYLNVWAAIIITELYYFFLG